MQEPRSGAGVVRPVRDSRHPPEARNLCFRPSPVSSRLGLKPQDDGDNPEDYPAAQETDHTQAQRPVPEVVLLVARIIPVRAIAPGIAHWNPIIPSIRNRRMEQPIAGAASSRLAHRNLSASCLRVSDPVVAGQ